MIKPVPKALVAILCSVALASTAHAATTNFFDASQSETLVTAGSTFDTVSSQGYRWMPALLHRQFPSPSLKPTP